MHIVFSEQGNAIEIIKKFRWFVQFESYFDLYASFGFLVLFSFGFLVLFSTNKTLRWIDLLFVSNFLQWLGSVGKFMSFQLYRCIYGVMFAIFSGCSPILKWFNAIITAYWKHLCFWVYCFALILLIQFWESMYDPLRLRLLYEFYRIFHQRNQHKFIALHCL